MRYFDEMQHHLTAYRDALYSVAGIDDLSNDNIEELENTLLEMRPSAYPDITDGITSLIDYVRDAREQHIEIDIDYVDEAVDELYYLLGIADQGTISASTEYYQAPKTPATGKPKGGSTPERKIETTEPEAKPEKPKEILKIALMSRGARYIFENNPFCVLGISSSASRSDALKVRDKLQKLDKLGAADSYSSPFDLANVEKPNRELGKLQVVLENISDLSHRWLWFRDAGHYTSTWDIYKTYRSEGSEFEYDRMFVVYLCLLLSDAELSSTYCWNSLLTAIDSLCKRDDRDLYEVIIGSLHPTVLDKYNYHMIAGSFRESILSPLTMNIEAAQGAGLLAMLNYFRGSSFSFTPILLDKTTESAFEWAYNKIDCVKNAVPAIPQNTSPTKQQVASVEAALDSYFDTDFEVVQSIASALVGVELYTERINDRIRSIVWDATNILSRGGLRAKACKYDCLIYPFCTESQQKEIKRFYPYEMHSLPDSAYTIEECQEAAKKFGEKNDAKNKFIWLLKAAEKGDAGSQNDVGVAYALGQGVAKDARKAVEWYEKAAAQGNAFALGNMASRYYHGTPPCRKDTAKAKDYWIRAVVAMRRKEDIDNLNEKFPGWQTSNHPSLSFGENDWEYKLRPMAELGVPSAEYWYGYHLLRGKNGCLKDQKAARRWILLSSAHGYYSAKITLDVWFSINSEEASTPVEMFNCGAKYAKLTGEQEADLAFYWYYRAYHSGYTDAANNLGVCYHDGKGTKTNYEMANQLYLVGISQNNSGSYYNYGYNLYYGQGVTKDIAKARQHLIKAADLGSDAAKTFLKDHFGITQVKYSSFEQLWFEHRDGISMSFYKLEVIPEGIKLTFWGKNTNATPRAFWLEYYTIDGERQSKWSKLIELGNGQYNFFSFIIDGKQKANRITVSIEIDQNSTEKVFSYPELVVLLDNTTGTVTPYISSTSSQTIPSDDDEDEEERDDFEDISFAMYDKDNLHIEFCYFEIEDEDVYMTFWVNNKSGKDYKFWAMEVNVDGDLNCHLESIGVAKAGTTSWCKLKLNDVSPESYYTIDCYIEIDDLSNNKLDRTPRVSVEVDFDDFTQSAELIDEEDEDEEEDEAVEFEDIEFVVYDNDEVYVEFCNFEVEDDEAYFSFWVRNKSDQTINIYAQEIYVDGVKVSDYMHIGEFEPGKCTHGRFSLEQVTPDTYYTIKAFIEIDDEDNDFIDSGDVFSIDVDFDDGTLSAEME